MVNPIGSNAGVDAADALAIAALLGHATGPLADSHSRRLAIVKGLCLLLRATAGHWAWGRGTPQDSCVAPLGIIDSGYTDVHRHALMTGSLLPDTDALIRKPVLLQLVRDQRAIHVRSDVVDDARWKASKLYEYFAPAGMAEWVQGMRYVGTDTWFNLFFFRSEADGAFGERESGIVAAMIAHAACLQVAAAEQVPAEAFVGLTSRQRAVMLLLLDGLGRKQVATTLQISIDTVNDHAKAIFKHFGVSSITELAARFLKNV